MRLLNSQIFGQTWIRTTFQGQTRVDRKYYYGEQQLGWCYDFKQPGLPFGMRIQITSIVTDLVAGTQRCTLYRV